MQNTLIAARTTQPWVAKGREAIRFGLAYGPRSDWLECRDLVQEAEAIGFDSYWTMDHPTSGMDCWTMLSALAVATSSIRLGVAVNCIFYRPPTLLARLAADVDRLSGGRLILGLGIPFLPVSERQEALAETLQIVKGLWRGTPFSYTGKHFQVREATLQPGPVQQPHVPVLIAGGGARVTLGRNYDSILRSYSAAPLLVAETQARLREKLDSVPAHIRQGYATSTVAGMPDELCSYYQALVKAGVRYFIVGLFGNDLETVRLLARWVVPQLTTGQTLPDDTVLCNE